MRRMSMLIFFALAFLLAVGGAGFAAGLGGGLVAQDSGGYTAPGSDGGALETPTRTDTTTTTTTEIERQPTTTVIDTDVVESDTARDDLLVDDGYGDEIFWGLVGLLVLALILWSFAAGSSARRRRAAVGRLRRPGTA